MTTGKNRAQDYSCGTGTVKRSKWKVKAAQEIHYGVLLVLLGSFMFILLLFVVSPYVTLGSRKPLLPDMLARSPMPITYDPDRRVYGLLYSDAKPAGEGHTGFLVLTE